MNNDGPNEAPITELFLVVSVDDNGNEGIVSFMVGMQWMPMMTSRKRLVPALRKQAAGIHKPGHKLRLIRLRRVETIEEIEL